MPVFLYNYYRWCTFTSNGSISCPSAYIPDFQVAMNLEYSTDRPTYDNKWPMLMPSD